MSGTRVHQRGAVLFGVAGGMFAASAGLAATYYVLATRSEAKAATTAKPAVAEPDRLAGAATPASEAEALLTKPVGVQVSGIPYPIAKLTWRDLGVEVDPDELARGGALADRAAKGALPLRGDRDKATKALLALKARYDKAPIDAYLDLEDRIIHDDAPGQGIDAWGSLGRIEAAARQGAPTLELVGVAVPAAVTKQGLGITEISNVMGHYMTRFPVTDRDRNFNLKLAASKINGTVIAPHEEWSFNKQVGERSEKEGYKIAHVITAGEMVDGLAGGTCQISTTVFGAAFFAGLDIVKTTNHSRPSVYTPLGFDATVVWPDTDLVLKNPYDFPIVLHYRVANGEALVEVLGDKRPFDKVEFTRKVLEETPYSTEERLDEEMPDGQTMLDQAGFNGYKLTRFRRFWQGKKMVREQKWTVNYKPVTEYVRRGTNKDPDAKMPPVKEIHGPKAPSSEEFTMFQ